jgi:DNA uptake protein ComE-like DNA-binding protein
MPSHRRLAALTFCSVSALFLGFTGCYSNEPGQRQRDERTRDEVAKATERAKPAIEEAGRKLGQAAESAAEQAHAAAQGVRDGWRSGQHPVMDLNSASERDLLDLPGITKPEAERIIAGRPYHDKHELVTKGILSGAAYQRIRDQITAKP